MEDMDAAERRAEEMSVPEAVVDGGEERWDVLSRAIARRIDQMSDGDVLEVISHDRHARADVPGWCLLHRHELLHVLAEGESMRFWIRKGTVRRVPGSNRGEQ